MNLPSSIDRDISHFRQFQRLFSLDFRREIQSKKFLIHLLIQFFPVIVVLVSYFFISDNFTLSLQEYTTHIILRLLLPLAAAFYATPIIMDELEKRTLTYLTLRPVPRKVIFISKLLASSAIVLIVTLIPYVTFAIFALSFGDVPSDTFTWFIKGLEAVSIGCFAYCAIFATLGTLFQSGLLASIIYYFLVELTLASLPVLDLFTVSTNLSNILSVERLTPFSTLSKRLAETFVTVDASLSLVLVVFIAISWGTLGTFIFNRKQFIL